MKQFSEFKMYNNHYFLIKGTILSLKHGPIGVERQSLITGKIPGRQSAIPSLLSSKYNQLLKWVVSCVTAVG